MTNLVLGIGLLVTNCNGQIVQRWTNLPPVLCQLTVERTTNGVQWHPWMVTYWPENQTNFGAFNLPLKGPSDYGFYRLLVN